MAAVNPDGTYAVRFTASNGDYISTQPSVPEEVINLFSQPRQGSQPTQGQVQPQPQPTQQGTQGRGRRQIEKSLSLMREGLESGDFNLVLRGLGMFWTNQYHGAEVTAEEAAFVDNLVKNYEQQGIEIINPFGTRYVEGMKVIAEFKNDESLQPGEQRIVAVGTPQVNTNGKMSHAARITVAQSPININPLLSAVKLLYSKGKEVASKIYERMFFDVVKTPDFMRELGLRGEKFTIRYGVISRHFQKDSEHYLPIEFWQQLPLALQDPIAITKYYVDEQKKVQKGYRIYTSLQLANGKYIAVGVEVANAGKNIEINKIDTIFGRDAISKTHETIIHVSPKITPEQSTLLGGHNPHQYSTERESESKDTQSSQTTQDPVQEIADGTVSLMGSVQAAQKAMAHTVAEAQKKLAEVDRKIEAAEVVLTDPKSVKRYKDLQAQAQQLRQTIDSYTAAMERLAQPQAQPTGDTGTQEDATPEDVRSVPLYTEEEPKQGRTRGWRKTVSDIVRRPEKVAAAKGGTTRVKFSTDTEQEGVHAVIEADELQPSHRQGVKNPYHFLDEAQPKDREGKDSVAASRKIAAGINPQEITGGVTAYTGSPSVNARGEVIQGNNRADALIYMYANEPEAAARYKQYLVEHADEFGLDAEKVASMSKPVLVNMLDVPDDRAIELGQLTSSDLESGGTQPISPSNVANQLASKGLADRYAGMLLRGEEDESISELVVRNGREALVFLRNVAGVINDTQYRSALREDGELTPEARVALADILTMQLLGGNKALRTMFGKLPAKAQKAIMATAYRDSQSNEADRMQDEIRASIIAFNSLMEDADFAKATNYEDARRAMEAAKRQMSWDFAANTQAALMQRFSNFALTLAAMYKGSTQRQIQATFNDIYNYVQGTGQMGLFDAEAPRPHSLEEAIRHILGLDYQPINKQYYGNTRSDNVGGNSPQGEAGGQGSPRDVAIGEQDTQGTAPSDSGRGTDEDGGTRGTDAEHSLSQEDTQSGQTVTNSFIDVVRTIYSKGKEAAAKLFSMKFFDVAETPNFMRELGLRGDKFTIRYGVIARHIGKDDSHTLPEEIWEQLPQALQNPFAITKYFTDVNRQQQKGYRLYTSLRLNNGSYVVVSAEVKNANRNLEVNAINTVFGRSSLSDVHDELIYTSETITPEQQSLLNGNNPRQYPADRELSSDKDTKNPETIQQITDAVEKLGLGVEIITSPSQLPKEEKKAREAIEKGAEVKGWYNAKTGKAYVYLPNAESEADVMRTIMHEAVAHKGLRGLLGKEGFDRLCDEVWDMMDAGQRRRFMAYVTRKRKMTETEFLAAVADGNKRRKAADEYIAHLAESLDTEKLANESAWKRVLEAVRAFLGRMGIGRDANISDESITRLLQDSYRQLRRQKEGGNTENIIKENISKAESEVNVTPTEAQDSSVNKQKQEEKDIKRPAAKIEDVGEKIGGARKDIVRRYADKIDLDGNTLSKMFPKPDIPLLIDAGVSLEDAASVKSVYDAAKSEYKRHKDTSRCIFYAMYAKHVLNGKRDLDMKYGGYVFTEYGKEYIRANEKAYAELYRRLGNSYSSIDLSDFAIIPRSGIKGVDLKKLNAENQQRKNRFAEINGTEPEMYMDGDKVNFITGFEYWNPRNQFETLEEAIDAFIENVKKNTTLDVPKYETGIYYGRNENGTIDYSRPLVCAKIRGFGVVNLKSFENMLEARKWLETHKEDVQQMAAAEEERLKKEKGSKKTGNARIKTEMEKMRSRVGNDYRGGQNVGAKEVMDFFGFRAIEFGNYVSQKERQDFLNMLYDSLMDLSNVIGISPRALSLGGDLAMAYGARGKSGASGHYEADRNVINITKTKGAGVLAHEWMHALDRYFSGFDKNRIEIGNQKYATSGKYSPNIRQEMKDAFVNLMKSIKSSEFYERSKRLSSYHSLDTELAARALQDYVIRRLEEKGSVNDFLSNHLPPEKWDGSQDTYPFPVGNEVEKIGGAFDNLFNAIQEKVDEETGNVVLFNIAPVSIPSMTDSQQLAFDAVSSMLENAGIEVEYVSEARLQELSELSGAKLEAKRKSEARRKRDEQNHAIDHVTSLITGLTEKEARQERLRWEQQHRDLAKEIYEAALQGNFNYVTLQKINKYIDESTPKNTFGRRISQRVPQKMERSLHEGTRTNAVDALFTRISESAVGDAGTKLARNRSEREGAKEIKKGLLKGWAIATGNWHTGIHDFTNDSAPLAQGRDSTVYKSKDGRHVIKFSKGKSDKRFSTDIDAANLFSFVFPNTAYDILGYGEIDGNFVTILQQPVVDIERALTEQERVDYMRSLGFNPINKENTAFSNGDIVVADIQKGNVVYDKDGNVSVLDADVKLHTKDIGGAYTYPPAATDTEQRIDSEQPKFQRDENSVIYGAAYNGKIYLNGEHLNPESPIHEYTHIWAEALRRGNRREWDSIVDMLRGTPQWNETKQRYPELTTDDRIAEETLALYSGMRGAQRLREQQQKIASEARSIRETVTDMGAIARVKQALKRFWKNVAGFLHLHYESVDEVADKVLADMLDGVNPIYMATTVKVTPITKRFANFEEAKAWAKKHIARVYDNTETGGKGNIEISKRAIDKYFSSSAVSKSDNAEVHKAVVSVLPEVIKESIVGEIHPDYLKKDGVRSPENGSNPGTEIHRLFGAVSIDGQIYRVKTTVKYLKKEATTTKFIHTKW